MKSRILLIEDDEELLQLFADALVESGYYVDKFGDPLKAFSVFEQNADGYDLILNDTRMPGIMGLNLERKMKNVNPNIHCALMTAFETDSFQEDLGELELSSFMKKPMDIEQLVNAVKACIANSRSEKFR